MGRAAAWPFEASGLDIVVIENDLQRCEVLKSAGIPFIEGDSIQESTLREAGVERARGLLALLDSDPHNLYIVLTARELNPKLHIIARVEEESAESRAMRAGANSVIAPFAAAGCRVGSSMIESTRSEQQPTAPATDPERAEIQPPTSRSAPSKKGDHSRL